MKTQKLNVILSAAVREFLHSLPEKARDKIVYNINLVAGGLIDKELFKKLEGSEIWEFRTLYSNICYRLLSFFDKDTRSLVITTHGFIKKTSKTPRKEIDKAVAIMKEYYNQKNK